MSLVTGVAAVCNCAGNDLCSATSGMISHMCVEDSVQLLERTGAASRADEVVDHCDDVLNPGLLLFSVKNGRRVEEEKQASAAGGKAKESREKGRAGCAEAGEEARRQGRHD